MKIRIDGSACYMDDEPDENGVHHGEWKHSGVPVSAVWNDEDNKWEERQVVQDDSVAEEFKRRFRHYDGYRSQVAQQDLLRVFRSGVQWAESRSRIQDAEVAARALYDAADEIDRMLADPQDELNVEVLVSLQQTEHTKSWLRALAADRLMDTGDHDDD